MRKSILPLVLLPAALFTACGTHSQPNTIYMPDMVYSPALKAQKEGSMRPPVAGTIPRDYTPFQYLHDNNGAAKVPNPLRPTSATLARGQAMFNTYCMPCHGPNGEGDGTIVPRFPRPPSLQSDKIRGWKDGQIFQIVSAGRNLMPSYASQIATADRWAIALYVRALQKAKNPTPEDVKAAEQLSK